MSVGRAETVQGFIRRDHSVSMLTANIVAVAIALPLTALLALPYFFIWGGGRFGGKFTLTLDSLWMLLGLVVVILGIVAHELIHGLTWVIAARKPWHVVDFGIQWKTFTPYAHIKEPLPVGAYRLGGAMPGLLLGIVPIVLATITGNGWLLAFGLLFTFAAGGDWLILWTLRGVRGGALVEDHPTRAGCYVLEPAPH